MSDRIMDDVVTRVGTTWRSRLSNERQGNERSGNEGMDHFEG